MNLQLAKEHADYLRFFEKDGWKYKAVLVKNRPVIQVSDKAVFPVANLELEKPNN